MNRIAFALAMVSVVCVLAVFFFPAVRGPYSAVHGPVTVMHAARAATGVRMAVARAGLSVVRIHFRTALVLRPCAKLKLKFLSGGVLSGFGIPLRC